MARYVTLVALLVLCCPATALAASAHVGDVITDPKSGNTTPTIFFTAAPGERNAITMTRDGLQITLRDAAATVQAGWGCSPLDAHTVVCGPFRVPPAARTLIEIEAGDGNDVVTVPDEPGTGSSTSVRGGAGDDKLTGAGSLDGGPGRDVLTAGASDDFLRGGSGADILRGAAGDDTLEGEGGDDRVDGGPGRDRVTYSGKRRGVRVDLAARTTTGRDGDRDRLAGIEDASGGRGSDTILGDRRANALDGGAGDDVVRGRSGHDRLDGGLGNDTVSGGGGDDELTAFAGIDTLRGDNGDDSLLSTDPRDALFGGDGNDTLTAPQQRSRPTRRFRCGRGDDTVAGSPHGGLLVDCERVQLSGGRLLARPLGDGSVRFSWACSEPFLDRCSVTASLRRGSVRVATGTGTGRTNELRSFDLRPRPRLERGAVVVIGASGTSRKNGGFTVGFDAHWRVRL